MPVPVARKCAVAKSKCLAAALYGVEATPVAKGPLKALRTKLVRLLDTEAATHRASALSFGLHAV
eukprot:1672642-Alexandrium_andersonii.AAC.1